MKEAAAVMTCPYCASSVSEQDEAIACPGCCVHHHRDCWVENHGCAVTMCSERPPDTPAALSPVPPRRPSIVLDAGDLGLLPEPVRAPRRRSRLTATTLIVSVVALALVTALLIVLFPGLWPEPR